MDRVDCVVVGAGVVGLAVARTMAQTGHEVIVLETEADIGTHTSSRNSEVIHAGIYYPTNSLKAQFCVTGKQLLYDYCRSKEIRHTQIGKLIIANSPDEIEILTRYEQQASANGVQDLRWLEREEVTELEPAVNCNKALLSPSTGIIDSHEFMLGLQADIEAANGAVICHSRVEKILPTDRGFILHVDSGDEVTLRADRVVNAAGLWAPSVARKIQGIDNSIVPESWLAKGHYYTLAGKVPFKRLVYPVAGRGGLGIHLTLDLAGQGRFGPDVEWIDSIDYTFDESRKLKFVNAIRSYYPDLNENDLVAGYTGIRPKLCGPGEQPADFMIQGMDRHGITGLVNLFGIESPGLTASLAIAAQIASELTGHKPT